MHGTNVKKKRNTSFTLPSRQGVNLGSRERILKALCIFKFCILGFLVIMIQIDTFI